MLTVQQMIELLRKDVVLALGCTEPVCVAFCAANAGTLLEEDVTGIEVEVNSGIYKNGMSAGIPNCPKVGLHHAAALGAFLRNPKKKLEMLEDITPEMLKRAIALAESGNVKVQWKEEERNLYVKCVLYTEHETSCCVIRHAHTNVVELYKNGVVLMEERSEQEGNAEDCLVSVLKEMTVAEIRSLVDSAPEEELYFLGSVK